MLHGVPGANRSMPTVMMPASTSPPGQPACRMFSHFVLLNVNIVATTGLMYASTVPLESPRISEPQYSSENAASVSPPRET